MTRTTIAAALLSAGCGNYSTEDLEFFAALPQREDLRARVPSGGIAGAATVCPPPGEARVWLESRTASNEWNAGVELVIGLVDVVRGYPPTWRHEDERRWGPFPDERHPGIEIQILMSREYPPELNGDPRYLYAFQARPRNGTDPFTNLIVGAFEGPTALRGKGLVSLDFEAFWTLGMNDAGTPHGTALIAYDRTGEPVRIFFTLSQEGFATPQFVYAFRGWGDGSGRFGYRFRELTTGNVFTVFASYDSAGAGQDAVAVTTPGGFTGGLRQCWTADACLVYVNDPWNLTSACPAAPCTVGSEAACPVVPEAPEAPWE